MIISGGARSNWRFFAKHLMKAEENEHVAVAEVRGLAAQDVKEAFREMDFVASGSRAKNFFYHANMNPREGERLTPEQWEQAVDTLEKTLGLEGQARFVVEHEKNGRVHRHVVWSRIDPETMTAISDSQNYAKHQQAARELEQAFGLEPVQSVNLGAEGPRPERRPKNWETFRGHQSGIDPEAMKAELTELWRQADSGKAFAAALEEHGYILARGDRRDFCVIDRAGDEHSLARRIKGAKAATIRERMADIDRDSLPSVAEARARVEAGDAGDAPRKEPEAQHIQAEPSPVLDATPPPAHSEPSPVLEAAKDLGTEILHSIAEEAEEHGGSGLKAVERGVAVFAAEELKDHWQEWVAKAREFLHDESSGSGLALHVEPENARAKLADFRDNMQSAMRENDGEPQGGLTVWERGAMLVAAAREQIEQAVTAVKGYWQDWVDRYRHPRDSDRGRDENEIER